MGDLTLRPRYSGISLQPWVTFLFNGNIIIHRFTFCKNKRIKIFLIYKINNKISDYTYVKLNFFF